MIAIQTHYLNKPEPSRILALVQIYFNMHMGMSAQISIQERASADYKLGQGFEMGQKKERISSINEPMFYENRREVFVLNRSQEV